MPLDAALGGVVTAIAVVFFLAVSESRRRWHRTVREMEHLERRAFERATQGMGWGTVGTAAQRNTAPGNGALYRGTEWRGAESVGLTGGSTTECGAGLAEGWTPEDSEPTAGYGARSAAGLAPAKGKRWRRGARFRRRQAREVDLAEMCVEVSSRLRSGSPVAQAWEGTWRRITGEDIGPCDDDGVPTALKELPGETAVMVVAAIRFSALTGAPLTDVLLRCAESVNRMEEAAAAQRVAFAGPRLSARVLTALPLVGLIGGELLGAHSLAWFASGTLPAVIGIVGISLTLAGHLVSRRLISSAARGERDAIRAPVLCDLAVAGLQGGAAIPAVLSALGEALGEEDYGRVGQELLLGATWHEAWDPMPPGARLVKRGLQPGWEDGVAPTSLLLQIAADARRRTAANAKEAAERLGITLALPLGLLLLPAFILLGLMPILLSLVGDQMLPALST